MMTKTALLFVNGEPPLNYPQNSHKYDYIACTDGAYHNYLFNSAIKPNFIIGDFDSLDKSKTIAKEIEMIYTPDQNKTDFEKAILFLAAKGVKDFVIYGAQGHSSDHFLGNLSIAKHYYHQYHFVFYDNYCRFFFANKQQNIQNAKDKNVSLIPIQLVTGLTITGFAYPLTNEQLTFGGFISLRNKIISELATIQFETGDLLVFIEHN